MLCDAYAIPCVLVSGTSNRNEAHMWNFVQMENGNWYAVDVAWDDQTDKTYYDFFFCAGQIRLQRILRNLRFPHLISAAVCGTATESIPFLIRR